MPGLVAQAQASSKPRTDAGCGPLSGDLIGAQQSGEIRSSQGFARGTAHASYSKQNRTRGKKRTMEEILQLRLSKKVLRQKGKKKKSGCQHTGQAL
ncbi:hypothetical protein Ancab_004705, partial [Ancistrocladus abbreviatus]